MKKKLLMLLLIAITTVCLVLGISACSDGTLGLEYVLSSDSTYYMVMGIGSAQGTDITIPSKIKGKPVKEIRYRAFEGCNFTSITIPDSITSIGSYAFYGCDLLKSISISNNVTSIRGNAFQVCSSLESIVIGNGVTSIGEWILNDCDSLKAVYYTGSENQWNKIDIGDNNSYLTNINIIFNYNN